MSGEPPKLPVSVDLRAYHGDNWSQSFRFRRDTTPVDLTGSTVASQARNGCGTYTLPVTVDPDPTTGVVTIALDPAAGFGRYDYDIQVTDPATGVTTWVKGRLVIDQDVTA